MTYTNLGYTGIAAFPAVVALTLALFLFGFAIFPIENADAAALYVIQDQSTCEDTPVDGMWDESVNTCTLKEGLSIGSGDEVRVKDGITVKLESPQSISIAEGGTLSIEKKGRFEASTFPTGELFGVAIQNAGTINNHGTFNIFNSGGDSFSSMVGMINIGTINNLEFGTIDWSVSTPGAGGSAVVNTGTINNQGHIFSFVDDNGAPAIQNAPTGNLNNLGLIEVEAVIVHDGIAILNQGDIVNAGELRFSNPSGIGLALNQGTIHNSGLINMTAWSPGTNTGSRVGFGFDAGTSTINNSGSMVIGSTIADVIGIQSVCPVQGSCILDIVGDGSLDISDGGIVKVTDNSILNIHSGLTVNLDDGGEIGIGTGGLVTIEEGAELNIESGSFLTVVGESGHIGLINHGDISNDGNIANHGGAFVNTGNIDNDNELFNHFGGLFRNNGGDIHNDNDGNIGNIGRIENLGTIDNEGSIGNDLGGTIFNNDTIHNDGIFINGQDGTIENIGAINNDCGGTFTNDGAFTGNPITDVCDSDGDGIAGNVDTQPNSFSNGFSDEDIGGTTRGSITSRGGQELTIVDAPNPQGVNVVTDPSGSSTAAKVTACGASATYTLPKGVEVVITCGSVTTEVVQGPVDVNFVGTDGFTAFASIGTDLILTFDPTNNSFEGDQSNHADIIVITGGGQITVSPGETVVVISVNIDIKPGATPNAINIKNDKTVTVALLGSSTFNVNSVDKNTIRFGGSSLQPSLKTILQKVNGDAFMDLVMQFKVPPLGFKATDTQGCITGLTLDGQPFRGCDSVKIITK